MRLYSNIISSCISSNRNNILQSFCWSYHFNNILQYTLRIISNFYLLYTNIQKHSYCCSCLKWIFPCFFATSQQTFKPRKRENIKTLGQQTALFRFGQKGGVKFLQLLLLLLWSDWSGDRFAGLSACARARARVCA